MVREGRCLHHHCLSFENSTRTIVRPFAEALHTGVVVGDIPLGVDMEPGMDVLGEGVVVWEDQLGNEVLVVVHMIPVEDQVGVVAGKEQLVSVEVGRKHQVLALVVSAKWAIVS